MFKKRFGEKRKDFIFVSRMGNRKSSGMKLIPMSPSACADSSSAGSETAGSKTTDVDVRNLGEYMIKKMRKYGNSVAVVSYHSFSFLMSIRYYQNAHIHKHTHTKYTHTYIDR